MSVGNPRALQHAHLASDFLNQALSLNPLQNLDVVRNR